MPEVFEGDLAGAVFWGADLSRARFRDVDLTDARISHAWLVNVDIDALVEAFVINGVDVTDYVNERDPWYPLRAMLRPSDPEGMHATWAALEDEWAKTITQALALPEDKLHESVNGEWSFVETLRHLVLAMDKWFTVPILGGGFHPIGLAHTGAVDVPALDLDDDVTPSVSEALAVRAERTARLRDYLASIAATDFARTVDVVENGSNPVQECLYTIFEEEFWHNRYARRDLALLERGDVGGFSAVGRTCKSLSRQRRQWSANGLALRTIIASQKEIPLSSLMAAARTSPAIGECVAQRLSTTRRLRACSGLSRTAIFATALT